MSIHKKEASNKHPSKLQKPISLKNVLITFLVVVLFFSLLINLKFLIYGGNGKVPVLEDLISAYLNPTISPTVCRYHDYPPNSSFLTSYTVQSGDSLLSIARDKLRDPSRVTELINLNAPRYPQLSLTNPFLEVGWKLYLPPKDFPHSSGKIAELRGRLVELNYTYWQVQVGDFQGAAPDQIEGISKAEFRYKTQGNYKVGDCVNVFYDLQTNDAQAFLVTPQQ